MKKLLFSVGVASILASFTSAHAASSASSASSSAPTTVYTRLKQQVEQEVSTETFDDEVITFLQLASDTKWELTEDQIRDVLKGNAGKACADAPKENALQQRIPCKEMEQKIIKMAKQEQGIRSLGRRITTLINGYEMPLSNIPEQALSLSSDLLGILTIWSAGTGSIHALPKTPILRTINLDEDTIKPRIQALTNALRALPPEERRAAVWRYRYGVRLVTDQRSPDFPEPIFPDTPNTGTERQYLSKNWAGVQNALLQIWDAVRSAPLDTPLGNNEIAYVHIPPSAILPDNIIVWARTDSMNNGAALYGDAGLDWKLPLDPVFPSLKKDGEQTAILGGNFPPEPLIEKDGDAKPLHGMQLCSDPFSERGYLCRPFEELTSEARCAVEIPENQDTITLVHCTISGDAMKSTLQWCSVDKKMNGMCKPLDEFECNNIKGSSCGTLEECQKTWNCSPAPQPSKPTWCCLPRYDNMCAVTDSSTECVARGGSPSTDEAGCMANGCKVPENPDIRFTNAGADVCREIEWKNQQPFDPNTQCTIALRCSDNCLNDASAITEAKDGSGVIPICIDTTSTISTYLAIHELVHAYQKCNQPIGYDPYDGQTPEEQRNTCCRIEGEAYREQCAIMERDGVFLDTNGKPVQSIDGIPFTATTCAEALTNMACSEQKSVGGCFTSRTYPDGFIEELKTIENNNPKNVPASCEEAINSATMDPRVLALLENTERKSTICTPQTETLYSNRIGNNMCYIGACVEQSVELHRITAGRSTAGVQEEVSPYANPLTGKPLGNILMNPPLSQYHFPLYRPELLVRTLDAMLCQSVGLPPLMPPVRCAVEATRQLRQTRAIGFESALGLVGQGNEQEITLRDVLELSRGVGVRTGTELYANYLRESTKSFSDILEIAGSLLRELQNISFPAEMCPITPTLPSTPS